MPPDRKETGPLRTLRWFLVGVLLVGLTAMVAVLYPFLQAERHWQAAREDIRQFELARALEHLMAYQKTWPRSAEASLLAAQCARRTRKYSEAKLQLDRYVELDGLPEMVRLERALLQAQSGDLGEVENYLESCANSGVSEVPLILEALAQGYLHHFRLLPALKALDRLVEKEPAHPEAYIWRGWTYQQLHKMSLATADYRNAVKLRPDSPEGRLRLAEALVLESAFSEALDLLEDMPTERRNDKAVALTRLQCYRGVNKPDLARQTLQTLEQIAPDDPLVLTERGRILLDEGRFKEAESSLRKAQRLAPYAHRTGYLLQQSLSRQDKLAEAAVVKKRLDELEYDLKKLDELMGQIISDPRNVGLRCEVGRLALKNGKEQEGVAWLLGVLQEQPQNEEAKKLLAQYEVSRTRTPSEPRR